MGSGHAHSAAGANKRALLFVFGFTSLYLVAEVIGGLLTGSLALLADAGHRLTDVAGIGLALMAIRFAERPATPDPVDHLGDGKIFVWPLASAVRIRTGETGEAAL